MFTHSRCHLVINESDLWLSDRYMKKTHARALKNIILNREKEAFLPVSATCYWGPVWTGNFWIEERGEKETWVYDQASSKINVFNDAN